MKQFLFLNGNGIYVVASIQTPPGNGDAMLLFPSRIGSMCTPYTPSVKLYKQMFVVGYRVLASYKFPVSCE